MQPLVSILIPAYNAETWIHQTIRSALDQTWPHKEIIVVDDGSRDGTLAAARSHESRNVRVFSQVNRGASTARNAALREAQGEYLQWLDADDLLHPAKLERQMVAVQQGLPPRSLLAGAFCRFLTHIDRAHMTPTSIWRDLNPRDWVLRKFNEGVWLNPGAWLVSREITEAAGPWNEQLSLDDDGEYFTRVVLSSSMVRFVPDAIMYYRMSHTGSLSRSRSAKACRSLLTAVSLSIEHLLAVEDSPRTRSAGIAYLQSWYLYFYPDRPDLVQEANALATRMGGVLHPPALDWEYRLIRSFAGWKAAKTAMARVADIKLHTNLLLDRMSLYRR